VLRLQFNHFFQRYAYGLLLLTLVACSPIATKLPTTQSASSVNQKHLASLANIQSFSLKGRIGVTTNPRGFSGGIAWQHAMTNDNIDIFSPLGGKTASIVKTPSEVILTAQDGHSIKAQDAESLTEATLGWRLPLSGLSDWALGKPTKNKIDASTWNENGWLTTLKQDGWDISYENYTEMNGIFLPKKVLLKSDKVNLKLIVDEWINTAN
jgi:outer membrane lipoprotein LolB